MGTLFYGLVFQNIYIQQHKRWAIKRGSRRSWWVAQETATYAVNHKPTHTHTPTSRDRHYLDNYIDVMQCRRCNADIHSRPDGYQPSAC